MIIIGATIGTAAHGANGNVQGLFWCLTFARGITGVVSIRLLILKSSFMIYCIQGVGGEYPASSTSASESANEKMLKQRGPGLYVISMSRVRLTVEDSVYYGHKFRPECK